MENILKTTDPVKLSFARHLLDEAGIAYFVADQYISAVEGSIGAFPQRLMVAIEDASRARHCLLPLFCDDSETGSA